MHKTHSPLERPLGADTGSDDHRSDAGYPDASGPAEGVSQQPAIDRHARYDLGVTLGTAAGVR